MTIYWEVLLGTEKVDEALRSLYDDFGGIKPLASHLGLCPVTVMKKLKSYKIPMHPRGGAHNRIPKATFPDKWWNMSTEQVSRLTGYSQNYIRRLRKEKICQLEQSTKTLDPVSSSNIKQPTLPSTESEKE